MAEAARVWRHRTGEIVLDRTRVMGILNVTPDSFSDGGRYFEPDAALRHGLELVEQGADLLDIGGESTRPGSDAVSAEEEWRRIGTVIRDLAAKVDVPLSIDTMKAAVAAKAIDAGASLVNDVSGVRDPGMVRAVADRKAGVVVMHMAGNPKTMQEHPQYADVVREVGAFLTDRIRTLEAAGVRSDAVKSFNRRNDSYRNGIEENHRVDPRWLRGYRHRDGLFPFLPPDFPRRPPGGFPDARDRDRQAAALLRRLSPRETRRLPDRRLLRGHRRAGGRPRLAARGHRPPRLVRRVHGIRHLRETAHPDLRKPRGPSVGVRPGEAARVAHVRGRPDAGQDRTAAGHRSPGLREILRGEGRARLVHREELRRFQRVDPARHEVCDSGVRRRDAVLHALLLLAPSGDRVPAVAGGPRDARRGPAGRGEHR